ncbi:hypothetical protein SK128_017088, partial [Halocaridina rubra]
AGSYVFLTSARAALPLANEMTTPTLVSKADPQLGTQMAFCQTQRQTKIYSLVDSGRQRDGDGPTHLQGRPPITCIDGLLLNSTKQRSWQCFPAPQIGFCVFPTSVGASIPDNLGLLKPILSYTQRWSPAGSCGIHLSSPQPSTTVTPDSASGTTSPAHNPSPMWKKKTHSLSMDAEMVVGTDFQTNNCLLVDIINKASYKHSEICVRHKP